jgi:hypothetical protein
MLLWCYYAWQMLQAAQSLSHKNNSDYGTVGIGSLKHLAGGATTWAVDPWI